MGYCYEIDEDNEIVIRNICLDCKYCCIEDIWNEAVCNYSRNPDECKFVNGRRVITFESNRTVI